MSGPNVALDHDRKTSLDDVLATVELSARRFHSELEGGRSAEVIDMAVKGLRVELMPTASSRGGRPPSRSEWEFGPPVGMNMSMPS